MFCPKCGSQNPDETKFCRSCGTDISNVTALMQGRSPEPVALSEKYIQTYGRAIRGSLIGAGFSLLAWFIYTIPPAHGVLWTIFAIIAFVFLAAGISRFVQAAKLKQLIDDTKKTSLPAAQTEFLKPATHTYDTDPLARRPPSITEHTTRPLAPTDPRDAGPTAEE
jgi:uncharacterized membrane protein YvbJ